MLKHAGIGAAIIFLGLIASAQAQERSTSPEFAPGSTGQIEDLDIGGILDRARKNAESLGLNVDPPELTWNPQEAARDNVLANLGARAQLEAMLGLEKGSADLPGSERRQGSSVLVFVSLGMPDEALRRLGEDARDAGASLLLQGFLGSSATETAVAINRVFGSETDVGFAVDPTAFNRFNVKAVPTVIALANPLTACTSRFCAEDETPAHDRIAGNATLDYMLEALSERGDSGAFNASTALGLLREARAE